MAQHNEIEFEKELCGYLAANGWLYSANDTGYDRERALFPKDFLGWLDVLITEVGNGGSA